LLATLAPQDWTLAGTAWRATGINNGKQAVVSVAGAAPVTLAFAAVGQASGSAGCNRYAARYQADGARLSFQPPAATRRMCPDERLMEQEQAFLRALETVAAARLEGDRLELRRADGALAVTLVRDGGE
jgi:heat shock protein HslJ